jgi:hypothetical protein
MVLRRRFLVQLAVAYVWGYHERFSRVCEFVRSPAVYQCVLPELECSSLTYLVNNGRWGIAKLVLLNGAVPVDEEGTYAIHHPG